MYSGFVALRQPVFNRALEPWGTALEFIQPPENGPIFSNELTATFLLAAHVPQRGPANAKNIISFDAPGILDGMPRLLPPQGTYVEVDEELGKEASITKAASELKQAGYGIAVGGFRNSSSARALNQLADVLIIDGNGASDSGEALQELIRSAQQFGAKIQVRGLSSWKLMLQARDANANMFQGFFFNQMDIHPSGKTVSATQFSRLRLLEYIDRADADFKSLAQVIEADAALTYRLLVFLNSASFGLRQKLSSIQQALVVAGWKALKNWLKIILITDLSPTPRHQELCYYAAQRANFLQRVARAAGAERLEPTLSLLGLLSYLEAILEVPMSQALANLHVTDAVQQALCGQKSSLSSWLALAQAMESRNWEQAYHLIKSTKLCMADLARCYHESFAEVDTLFRDLPEAQATRA
jgi:EAL and modified HD-GYP domain-containing signal transduction protein